MNVKPNHLNDNSNMKNTHGGVLDVKILCFKCNLVFKLEFEHSWSESTILHSRIPKYIRFSILLGFNCKLIVFKLDCLKAFVQQNEPNCLISRINCKYVYEVSCSAISPAAVLRVSEVTFQFLVHIPNYLYWFSWDCGG